MPFLKWEMGLNFPGGGFATCICRSGDKRARLGDNWEGEQPACLSSGWLEGGLVAGQRAVPRWLRPLLPLISAWIGRWTGASLSVHRILGRIGHLMAIVSISPKLFDRSDNFIIKKKIPNKKSSKMSYSNAIWVLWHDGKKGRSLTVKGGGLFIYESGHLRSAWTGRGHTWRENSVFRETVISATCRL